MTDSFIKSKEEDAARPQVIRDFVIVRLDDIYLAFDIADVAEVLPYTQPVALPRAPKFCAGTVDVRGVMLPVIDLRCRADVRADERPQRILALRLNDHFIGASVDEVREVYAADESALDDPTVLADRLDTTCVRSTLRWGKRLVPVMDVMRLLMNPEPLRLKRTPHALRRRRGEGKR